LFDGPLGTTFSYVILDFAQRQPDGDFLAPARYSRQQEPSHIGTHHQQKQTDGHEQ